MGDMKPVIEPKSDQLNADDLISGSITIKIADVTIRSGQEQPISVHYEGDNGKPYKPCKSMCRVMVTAWGADSKKYVGRSMTLYRDPKVKWAGMEVGGIRISHMSHIDESMTMALTVTRANKKPFTVKPIVAGASKPAAPVAQPPLATDRVSDAPDAAGTISDDSLIKDIEGRVKRKQFDLAYDLARGIQHAALRDTTKERIDRAKAYVDAHTG